jgi:hypothetical protein
MGQKPIGCELLTHKNPMKLQLVAIWSASATARRLYLTYLHEKLRQRSVSVRRPGDQQADQQTSNLIALAAAVIGSFPCPKS